MKLYYFDYVQEKLDFCWTLSIQKDGKRSKAWRQEEAEVDLRSKTFQLDHLILSLNSWLVSLE